ncbi:MAG: hypothetical protein K0R44_2388, partial [Thermomicrobiales bacterium]|nr:hypothetical protein [Thermomicrobiales bacterium]
RANDPTSDRRLSLAQGTVPNREAFLVVCAQVLHAISKGAVGHPTLDA